MDGPTIARLRKRLGITQTELATMLSVDQGTVSRWERGNEAPRPAALKRLRDILIGEDDSRAYRQALARVRSDLFAAYLFDGALVLREVSARAMAHFNVHGVGLRSWAGVSLQRHLEELGVDGHRGRLLLDQLLSGTALAARITLPSTPASTALYLEPVMFDEKMVGLVVWVASADASETDDLVEPVVEVVLADPDTPIRDGAGAAEFAAVVIEGKAAYSIA